MITDNDLHNLMRVVGERVRCARLSGGLSAKALAEQTGISLRYISMLENGQGNVTISLLFKVADVLGHNIDWFFSDNTYPDKVTTDLLRCFHHADEQLRQHVLSLLMSKTSVSMKAQRIALLGLRGAGKNTLGKSLSARLAVPFLELNAEIEELCGMSIRELIELYGQEGYRQLEKQALENTIAQHEQAVIVVAGGIVASPETYHYLLQHAHSVWLTASPEEHLQRVKDQGGQRLMAGNPIAMNELKSILIKREALYAKAEYKLDTSNQPVVSSEAAIYKMLAPLMLV